MGASRKLQGEIDRVLKKVQEGVEVFDSIWNKVYDTDNANQKEKFEADLKKEIKKLQRYRDQIKTWIQSSEIKDKKVSATYEQNLMDARKSIEREMERFKICEKETKTKAFSKEGLGQQPKTDPKEKAKSETRDWLNNVVSELENQIDIFEAEMEGLTVKKGKTRPPRLTHLETSIVRHKGHISKLEFILRLLDNDQLSPEQVNDVKDFLDDYVERNQEDFDEFSEVDELYSTLPLDKLELLEDLVAIGPPGLGKSTVASSVQHGASTSDQAEEMTPQDGNTEVVATPISKAIGIGSSAPPTPTGALATSVGAAVAPPLIGLSVTINEEENGSSSVVKSTQVPNDSSLKSSGRDGLSSQSPFSIQLGSGSSSSTNDALGGIMLASDATKREILGPEDRAGSNGMMQSLVSPLANKVMLPQASRDGDGVSSVDVANAVDPRGASNQGFSAVPGMQWRPGSSFQNQNEVFRGRTEIAPDQREKFLQRFQQVQQQGQNNILGMATIAGGNQKQFSAQQQNPLFQQSQLTAVHQPSNQNTGHRDAAGVGHGNADELQLQQTSEDSSLNTVPSSGLAKNEDETEAARALDSPAPGVGSYTEAPHLPRENDLTSGHLLQSSQSSGTLGVIGRRSVADLVATDNLIAAVANSGGVHDHKNNLHMLEAAFRKLPQPKDSERTKSYTPKHPTVTPASYPQVQAPIVSNPAFFERLGQEQYALDTLFFAFYFQPNTYQQYLAAKELKKQSWRYHWKFNTWFQRHEEPIVATDDYERGKYLYFDFLTNDEQNGWCQRVKNDFTFEYNYLEDELIV